MGRLFSVLIIITNLSSVLICLFLKRTLLLHRRGTGLHAFGIVSWVHHVLRHLVLDLSTRSLLSGPVVSLMNRLLFQSDEGAHFTDFLCEWDLIYVKVEYLAGDSACFRFLAFQ